MFQFISVGGSCSFLHLGTVQERYQKDHLFIQAPKHGQTAVDSLYRHMLHFVIGMTRSGVFVIGALSRHQKCTN